MSVQKRTGRKVQSLYFRIAVPADLRPAIGRLEIVRSLRTSSRREAALRCHHVEAIVRSAFAQLRRHRDTMTLDQLKALADRYLWDQLEAAEQRAALTASEAPENPAAVEAHSDQVTDALDEADRAAGTKRQRAAVMALADELLREAGLTVDRESPEFKRFLLRLLAAQQEARKAELGFLRGDFSAISRPSNGATTSPAQQGHRLSEVVSMYLAKRRESGKWSPKTDKSVTGILSAAVELIGDRPMDSITKADMRDFQSLLSRVPAHAVKRYPGMSLREAIDRADAEQNPDRLSAGSKNDYMMWTRTLWKWALKNDLATVNAVAVLEDHQQDHERDQRGRFTPEQVAAILRVIEPERATAPAHWWVPRLMLATGLRLEEAAKLRPCDIQQDGEVWVIDVNDDVGRLKTRDSKRRVPIHSAIRADLVSRKEQVERERGPQANLWGLDGPDRRGRWSEQLSKRLNKRVDQADIKDKKLVMESARNTFIDALKQAGVDEPTAADLVGHRSGGTMSFSRYAGRANLERLSAAVEKIQFPLYVANE